MRAPETPRSPGSSRSRAVEVQHWVGPGPLVSARQRRGQTRLDPLPPSLRDQRRRSRRRARLFLFLLRRPHDPLALRLLRRLSGQRCRPARLDRHAPDTCTDRSGQNCCKPVCSSCHPDMDSSPSCRPRTARAARRACSCPRRRSPNSPHSTKLQLTAPLRTRESVRTSCCFEIDPCC